MLVSAIVSAAGAVYVVMGVVVVSLWQRGIRRIWRGEVFAPRRGEDPWLSAWVRTTAIGSGVGALMALYIGLAEAVVVGPGPAPAYLSVPFVVLLSANASLAASVWFVNWPKRIVPPNRRSEVGLATAWLERRRNNQ